MSHAAETLTENYVVLILLIRKKGKDIQALISLGNVGSVLFSESEGRFFKVSLKFNIMADYSKQFEGYTSHTMQLD